MVIVYITNLPFQKLLAAGLYVPLFALFSISFFCPAWWNAYNAISSIELKSISLDRLAAKLARKESLSQKLQQRPGRQELIDRNILYQVTEEEHCIGS